MHRVSSKYLVSLAIIYLLVGVFAGYYGTQHILLSRGLIAPRQEVVITDLPSFNSATLAPTFEPTPPVATPTPPPDQDEIQNPPLEIPEEPEPTPDIWGELDLTDGDETSIAFDHKDEWLITEPFYPRSYRPGIFESEYFDPDLSGAVSWVDHQARVILWAHSGPDHTMTPIQRAIELDDRGFIVDRSIADERLRQDFMGRNVWFVQPEGVEYLTFVSAWARVTPDLVAGINEHVDDLPEILRWLYPDQGWEGFNRDTLILFFCGRQLAGDPKDPTRPYWQQTRYVLGLLPHVSWSPTGPLASLGGYLD